METGLHQARAPPDVDGLSQRRSA